MYFSKGSGTEASDVCPGATNANTLIIYNADLFGLSQLYQLRGRVGRSDKRAYAYLTTKKGKVLNDNAIERLKVLKTLDNFI